MKLKLVSDVNKKQYIFTDLEDYNDSKLFYHISVKLDEDMDEGTYTYYLYDEDEKQVATGVLQIGEFVKTTTAYTKNNTFKVYNG